MKYVFTSHAQQRMREKGISVEEAVAVVQRGQKWLGKADRRWHARMGGIEAVFERKGGTVVIVTCYFE